MLFFKARECGPVLISMATHPVIQHWLSGIGYVQYILNTAAFKNNFKRLYMSNWDLKYVR